MIEISGKPDLNPDDPLVVHYIVQEGDYSEQALAKAAATASIKFMNKAVEPDDADTLEWLSGRYRKILRRAKAKDFAKVVESTPGLVYTSSEGVTIFVTECIRRSATPKIISKLQVSGLKINEQPFTDEIAPLKIVINENLGMGPAKSAIAVAHVAQLAMAALDNKNIALFLNWDSRDYPLTVNSAPLNEKLDDALCFVRDAGLTEVEPGSITAVAYWTE